MSVIDQLGDRTKASWAQVQDLGREARGLGRHVWLAGLGAVGTVDERGRGLFTDLVDRGQRFESRERPIIKERFRKAGQRIGSLRDKVEEGLEEKVAGTLQRFGVPDRDEVHQLIDRIERLTREVESLSVEAKA